MSASAFAAGPLPQNGQFVAGAGSISTSGSAVNITQSTTRGVIDWRSFSIGSGNSVTVNNGGGATLSRVTGTASSQIDGKLSASGSFYLINPQGVVIGANGVVATGDRFVASTLDIGNSNFMSGGSLNLTGSGDGVILNLGKISSTGGDVFLISRAHVQNDGRIDAPKGSAELATGSQVLLKDSATGMQVFVQPGTRGDVVNSGTITAAQINLRAADGNVFALAGTHEDLRATGTATRDGKVWLVADRGTAHVHSNVEASDEVITTGNLLHLDNANIHAGLWTISAPEFNAGPLNSATLASNLNNGTSITVNATAGSGSGDVNLGAAVRWTGDASLTLNAVHDVTLGPLATLANTGAGNLTLRADSHGIDNSGSVVSRGTIDWSKGTGVVATLYDMNGTYTPGTVRSNPAWSAAPFSGLLTQYTAYRLVNSAADFAQVSNNLAGVYALGRDVDLSTSTASVGGVAATPFTGQFDGMGHVVSNMFLGQTVPETPNYLGLFGIIDTTGVVRNLGVIDSKVNGLYFTAAGLVAGLNRGLITNTYSAQTGAALNAIFGGGGIAAENDGTIERSSSSVVVDSNSGEFHGIAVNNYGKIIQSFATGTGGLTALNSGSITQSYATGEEGLAQLGGIAIYNEGTINESFVTTKLTALGAPELKGGIVYGNHGTISNTFWDVQTTTAPNGAYEGTAVPAAFGLTTAQMSTASSFGPTWDFGPAGTWVIPAGGTHPILRWQLGSQQ